MNLLAGVPAIVKPATVTSYLTEAVVKKIIASRILPFRLIIKTLIKKEFLFLGVIYVISMILLACQGKNTNGTQNSEFK